MINGTDVHGPHEAQEDKSPAADTSRQKDPALCPAWCDGQHRREAISQDFHHDGESKWLLPANQQQHDADEYVSVFPSQLVDGEGVTHAPLVELFIENKGCRLTPLEAVELASNLSNTVEELLLTSALDAPAGGTAGTFDRHVHQPALGEPHRLVALSTSAYRCLDCRETVDLLS